MRRGFFIPLIQVILSAGCAHSQTIQTTPTEPPTQWIADHFDGCARLTYNGTVSYGAFVQDNYHSSRVPELGFPHLYRVTFTPERLYSFPATQGAISATAQATDAGHTIFVWGAYTLDCTPADAVIRAYFKLNVTSQPASSSQKMLDARM